jgi:hypothetical protein
MAATATKPLPNLRPAPFLTSGQLSKETGLPQGRIQELVPEGLPAYELDSRRYVYDRDEAIAWLTEHGHLFDPYRAAIKRLVDGLDTGVHWDKPTLTPRNAQADHPQR